MKTPISSSKSSDRLGPKTGAAASSGLRLAERPVQVGAADDDRAGPAVIGDRQVQPVRHQRVLRPAQHGADVGGVLARRIEVGVIADLDRQAASRPRPSAPGPRHAAPDCRAGSARRRAAAGSCVANRVRAARPKAKKSFNAGLAKTARSSVGNSPNSPRSSNTDKSKTISPIATPARGGAGPGRNTPNGKF